MERAFGAGGFVYKGQHSVPGSYQSSRWDADLPILKVIGLKPGLRAIGLGAKQDDLLFGDSNRITGAALAVAV